MAEPDPQLKDLQTATATAAPMLARVLGTPNTLIAVSALGKSLLGDAQATLADIVKAAKSKDAGTSLQIVQAEQDTQLRLGQSLPNTTLADLDRPGAAGQLAGTVITGKTIYTDDSAITRQRQVKLHDETNKYLAFVITIIFFALLILLMLYGNRIDNTPAGADIKDLLFTLFGVVATVWASIIGFYFGSSSGSQQKSQILSTVLLQKMSDP